eukprot:gene2906-biopygen2388
MSAPTMSSRLNSVATECLLLDQTIDANARSYKRPLSVAWIDFRKAFDLVPDAHIVHMLETLQVPPQITATLRRVMPHWQTAFKIVTNGKPRLTKGLPTVRGLFQGHSLSRCFFCLAIAPLSTALDRRSTPYMIRDNITICHLLYMDDLKVYSPSQPKLEKAVRAVERASSALGMELDLRKCALAHRNGKGQTQLEKGEGNTYHNFPLLQEKDSYKYLGLQQLFQVNQSETGHRVLTMVNATEKALLNTDLNRLNLTTALATKITDTM